MVRNDSTSTEFAAHAKDRGGFSEGGEMIEQGGQRKKVRAIKIVSFEFCLSDCLLFVCLVCLVLYVCHAIHHVSYRPYHTIPYPYLISLLSHIPQESNCTTQHNTIQHNGICPLPSLHLTSLLSHPLLCKIQPTNQLSRRRRI